MRRAIARRVALRRPRPERSRSSKQSLSIATTSGHCPQGGNRSARAPDCGEFPISIPSTSAIAASNEPKPIAQAVMFCLMDVSGSMSEHMKDLAKRFYMLLYVFLTRRYRHVEIVFIRHTDRAEEVTRKPSSAAPLRAARWSPARSRRCTDRQSALPAADWNIYAAQASDGDNSYATETSPGGCSVMRFCRSPAISPIWSQRIERSDTMPDSPLWTLYQRLRQGGAALSMRKVQQPSRDLPGVPELFQRRDAKERATP